MSHDGNAPSVSRGIRIIFEDSGFSGCITNVTPPNITRESLDISCQSDNGAMKFIPAWLYDGGELTFTVQLDPETIPPIITDAPANEIVRIEFPDSLGQWEFLGHMSGYAPTADLGQVMQAAVTVKVADDIDIEHTS